MIRETEIAPPSWHALEAGEAARRLGADLRAGLSPEEASRRPAAAPLEPPPAWRLALATFASQWKGSVILILCAAAAALWMLGHWHDAVGIGLSVLFAVFLGFLTDFRSQGVLAAMKSLNAPLACVVRGGLMIEIPASRVVSGDLLSLCGGVRVPADGRVVESSALCVDESSLTGESVPVLKGPEPAGGEAPLAERSSMVYAGTVVLSGSGRILATAVGSQTELGRIGRLAQGYRKEGTPMEREVESLGRRLGLLVIALSAAATALGLGLGQRAWDMIETGFLLAIAAIPEGLPAVTAAALAGGVRRMARRRAIVRRLAAVEALGSVDVVCTDKTGTLTENAMRAAVVFLPGRRLEVTGSGYEPRGEFLEGRSAVDPRGAGDLSRFLWIAALCNDAVLESHEGWHVHGSPTEGALLTLAAQGGLDPEALRRAHPRLRELSFDSSRKRMMVVVGDGEGAAALVKGAVDELLPLCEKVEGPAGAAPLSKAQRGQILGEAERLGSQGLRVLGLAYRRLDSPEEDDPEKRLVWAGMAGLLDPPRRSAAEAVSSFAQAGVRIVMATGDQKKTAEAVARRLGLPLGARGALEGGELEAVLGRGGGELEEVSVLARVSAGDKLRLVQALKSRGHVVAMTGDGINDAPALKAADIGVAMGSAAADVAKEAADIVIMDSEFETLTEAIEEGRRIYANIRRAARYLMLCSMGNIGLMAAAIALRLPLPMTALQLLWLNLVVHIFPAVALAVAPNPRRFMREPPRPRSAKLMGWPEIREISLWSAAAWAPSLAVFALELPGGVELARTAAMSALGVSLLAQTLGILSEGRGLINGARRAGGAIWLSLAGGAAILAAMLYFPPLRGLLKTSALTPRQWLGPLGAAFFSAETGALLERLSGGKVETSALS